MKVTEIITESTEPAKDLERMINRWAMKLQDICGRAEDWESDVYDEIREDLDVYVEQELLPLFGGNSRKLISSINKLVKEYDGRIQEILYLTILDEVFGIN